MDVKHFLLHYKGHTLLDFKKRVLRRLTRYKEKVTGLEESFRIKSIKIYILHHLL